MPSVLFVCTANQFRSPLAAACLRNAIREQGTGQEWIVESAGTWAEAGLPAAKMLLQVAPPMGISGLENHLTQQTGATLLNRFDLILLMEAGQKEALAYEFPALRQRLYLLSEVAHGIAYDIPDPGAANVNPREVSLEIQQLISHGKAKILALAESLSRRRA